MRRKRAARNPRTRAFTEWMAKKQRRPAEPFWKEARFEASWHVRPHKPWKFRIQRSAGIRHGRRLKPFARNTSKAIQT
jgi:hypothetical protein